MNKAIGFAVFMAGVAVGSATAWFYAKKKYEKIAQEEINSVKEVFAKNANAHHENDISKKDDKAQEKAELARDKPSVAEYAKKLSKEGYTDYSKSGIMVDEDDEEEAFEDPGQEPGKYFGDADATPYVIAPEQFAELDGYDQISLTYYADHILADDNDQLLEDVDGTVGFESLTHFGEYEDDSVYVRNDRLKTDYEILRDERKYSDVIKTKPYLKEV